MVRYLVALRIEKAVLVLCVVVVEAVQGGCAGGDGASVGAVVEGLEIGGCCCPCGGGVEEGRVEVERHGLERRRFFQR